MALGPLKAKQDRPGHCCACNCLSGRFCTRWTVITATDITLCELLWMETGAIIKWNDQVTNGTSSSYTWRREPGGGIDQLVLLVRLPVLPPLPGWRVIITDGPKLILGHIPQPVDEQLLIAGTNDAPIIAGPWDDDDPVGTVSFSNYALLSQALLAWPDAVNWTF